MTIILSPEKYSIFQRDKEDNARIPITIQYSRFENPNKYKITVNYRPNQDDMIESKFIPKAIKCMFAMADKKTVKGEITLPKGNYQVFLNFQHKTKENKFFREIIDSVGVGDIFITAGQSNAAFYGESRQTVNSTLIRTMTKLGWDIAHDENANQLASGNRGSPWPVMGEYLLEKLDIPIGFVNVAKGGSKIEEWQEDTGKYRNLVRALERLNPNGARAILWHQGESASKFSVPKETYKKDLRDLISSSRKDSGFNIPWVIAMAAYNPRAPSESINAIIEAQKEVCHEMGGEEVYLGPTTEDITTEEWRFDGIHFSNVALHEVGMRFGKLIYKLFFKK